METKTNLPQPTRRAFLGTATALSAASYSRVLGANDRVGIGMIGFGLISNTHIRGWRYYKDVDILGLSEVYKPRLEAGLALTQNPNTKGYSDFRNMLEDKNIQGIFVGTPDHWHTLMTVMGCAAGKDVYVEKPLTVYVDEGKWMIQARDKYKRQVVVGNQRNQRPSLLEARKIIQSGVLGKIHMVKLSGSSRNAYPGFGKTPVEPPPADFDYDMWLGPAPKKPYQKHRGLYHFRWMWDYSGGQLTNLGAHSISAFLRTMDVKGPNKIVSFGGRELLEDDGETPDTQEVIYEFPEGFRMTTSMREANDFPYGDVSVVMGTKGNLILGSNTIVSELKRNPFNTIPRGSDGHPIGGVVYDDTPAVPWIEGAATSMPEPEPRRARGEARPPSPYAPADFPGEDMLYMNQRDFIECIRDRSRKPICDLETGHRTAVMCNLGNMSLRLGGRMIQWDRDKEVVIGDKEAAARCTPQYRAPWDGVLKSLL